MINQKHLQALLRRVGDSFISIHHIMHHRKLSKSEALQYLAALEQQGYIEKAVVSNEHWIVSYRGKVLVNTKFAQVFKVETIQQHVAQLLERIEEANALAKYPHSITCVKIIGPYPIQEPVAFVNIAYALERKPITEEAYDNAVSKLMEEKEQLRFNNIIERYTFPETAIRDFLKGRSRALRLKSYDLKHIELLEGTVLFAKYGKEAGA